MGFDWRGLRFEGTFQDPTDLLPKSGIYVIWCNRGNGLAILDIGESGDVRGRVLSHRKDCWQEKCVGQITYAAHYTPALDEAGRKRLESQLRTTDHPPCGSA